MIKQIDHIAIAVHSLDHHIPIYRDLLGLPFLEREVINEQKVTVAIFKIGEVRIELLEPIDEHSPISNFLEKKGEGLHHIAFRTDNIEPLLLQLKEKGVQLIDEKPRQGAGGTKIAFLHPRSTGKVLMEICQK